MSVSVTYAATLAVAETIAGNSPFAAAAKKIVTHDQLNQSGTLSSGTTPPATQVAGFQKALSAGAATIDLTALTGTNGATVDNTGLKLQLALFRNPAGNANAITVTIGASNGYSAFGAAWKLILSPGMWTLLFGNDATPDVAGAAKNIDLAGTGTQAIDCLLVFG